MQNGVDPKTEQSLGVVAVGMTSYRAARYIHQHLNHLAIGATALEVEFDGTGTSARNRAGWRAL